MNDVDKSLRVIRVRNKILEANPERVQDYVDVFFTIYDDNPDILEIFFSMLKNTSRKVSIQNICYEPEKSGLRTILERRIAERQYEIGLDLAPTKHAAFPSSAEYIYIEQFVTRFGKQVPEDDLSRLLLLLGKKGWGFSLGELVYFVNDEFVRQRKSRFRTRVMSTFPVSIVDFFESYVDSFQKDDFESLQELCELLKREGIGEYSLDQLSREIHDFETEKELEVFERQLASAQETIGIGQIDAMGGYEFEDFLKQLYAKMGYMVEQTRLSGDQGADLVISKSGIKSVIQAKCYSGNVGNYAVQEVLASCKLYGAERALVVTNSYFTQAAVELAGANNVELVDRDVLIGMVGKYW